MDKDVASYLALGRPGLASRWDELLGESHSRRWLQRLRDEEGPGVARFVSLQLELATKAAARFPDRRLAFWTSKGLEQATSAAVADFRAAHFRDAIERCRSAGAVPLVWDTGSGAGADAVSLARTVPRLVASDLDPASARCTAANLQVASERGDVPLATWAVIRADMTHAPLRIAAGGNSGAPPGTVFGLFDPDRRPAGQREGRPGRWSPPLDVVLAEATRLSGACVKLPPGLDPAALTSALSPARSTPPRRFELQWVSLGGELKELMLLLGDLTSTAELNDGRALPPGDPRRTALALGRDGQVLAAFRAALEPMPDGQGAEAAREGRWLIELDPSVRQAGLAGAFASRHGLEPLGDGSPNGYLLADRPPPPGAGSGLARSWRILGSSAVDRRRVRDLLRRFDVGPLVVKKQDHPETAEALERRLRGTGERRGLLAVTRVGRRSLALLLEPPGDA